METHDKIRELTEKIHREGFEKANREAEEIIDRAKKEAEEIVAGAKKDADSIIRTAKKEAEDTAQKITSEVRLSAQQAILNLKKEIGELIQTAVLKEPLKEAFDDSQFVRSLLETLVKNWDSSKEDAGLEVYLPKDQLRDTEEYFKKRATGKMGSGIRFREYNGPGKGFEIQSREGHYKINVTDEAFEEFLKEHFRPRTMEFLYGGKG
ncbi:MAG: hypothetical protein JXR52_11680 [Bacteroidales bacterium]|nr:hypothetical protein [Bacteroidales bacterium]